MASLWKKGVATAEWSLFPLGVEQRGGSKKTRITKLEMETKDGVPYILQANTAFQKHCPLY